MLENTNSESNIPEATATNNNMEIKEANAMMNNNTEMKDTNAMVNNNTEMKDTNAMTVSNTEMRDTNAMTVSNTINKITVMKNREIQKKAMVPKEELAVSDNLTLRLPSFPDFQSLVLPDEKAEKLTGDWDSVAKYRELGFFSPVRGMANISNRLNGKIYAKIHEAEKGQRYVEYAQKYINESFSPRMSLSQAGMRIAAQYNFSSKGIPEAKLRNKISNFILEANDDYYGKFKGVLADELNIEDILNVLYSALPFLPVQIDGMQELEEETFYQLLDFHINNNIPYLSITKGCKSYYPLDEECLETIANNMQMKKRELLKKLKQYDLLYLTPSSKGYQTNIRLKYSNGSTYTEWRYCIYKLSFFANIKEDTSRFIDPNDL